MSYLFTPFGTLRGRINRKLKSVEHEVSFNRYHRARRDKVRNSEKYAAAIESRKALGLPAPQRATLKESILRMHHGSKRKVTLPVINF